MNNECAKCCGKLSISRMWALKKMLRVKSFSNADKETMTYAQGLRRRYIGIGTQNM